ncbi:MAG: mucin-2 protein [Nocardioidaceae bacterium]
MTSARHRQADERPSRRRLPRLVLPAVAATVLTTAVVGVCLGVGGAEKPVQAAAVLSVTARATSRPAVTTRSPFRAERVQSFSRSAERVTLHTMPKVEDRQFMTAALNLWPSAREKGKPLAVLHEGGKVALTGVHKGAFAQILRDGQVRWVKKAYLVDKLPEPAAAAASGSSAGVTSAPCPDGSGTESGLTSGAVRLFRSVCNAFPALTTYGGFDNHGEHSSGKAIDFMISDSGLGQAVADWARAHAFELDLYDVIWSQHIWTPVRSGEGWRSMSDRGSATANHFDHVHISVN